MVLGRADRRYSPPRPLTSDDLRTEGQRDRDRILYTSALRRLAGVTQVVSATEGHVFHNRLTHTLEVAQIARRLAERLLVAHTDLIKRAGTIIDPDIAEAAALAHDLGHPPFGHVAEDELEACVRWICKTKAGLEDVDGFEGNAQSFRIVTQLAAHRTSYTGLDLTRAGLNAILKYPHYRGEGHDRKTSERKYGAYRSETADFEFARDGSPPFVRSLEAEIMNFADDIAYSVHDVDDLFRAGLVPLDALPLPNRIEREVESFKDTGKLARDVIEKYEEQLVGFVRRRFTFERYGGTYVERAGLRAFTSELIRDFMIAARLEEDGNGNVRFAADPARVVQMKFLQNLVWRYVIEGPRLASQQHGQQEIVRSLFNVFFHALYDSSTESLVNRNAVPRRVIPPAFRQEAERIEEWTAKTSESPVPRVARFASDIVASLTDHQAVVLHHRLAGITPGSVTDIVNA